MKKLAFIIFSVSIFAGLPSCIQRYDAPAVNTPNVDSWKSKDKPPTAESPYADCPDPEQVLVEASFRPWWKAFNDDKLNELEYEAIKESPKVQAAVARLEQAMGYYGITRASLFPQVVLDVGASRQRISRSQGFAGNTANSAAAIPSAKNIVAKDASSSSSAAAPAAGPCTICLPIAPPMCACPPPAPIPVPKPITHISTLSVIPTLTYELDFWGKNWQATQSALKQVAAEQEDLQNTLLNLTTSVADAYLQTRTFDNELAILKKTIFTRRNNFKLNKEQYKAGLINGLAVEQARSDYENVAAQIEDTKRLRALSEHSLAELVGKPASTFTLEKVKTLPFLPTIASGFPSAMLQRRPDIRKALALIDSASLDVGVAKTEYFPDFTITLDYGFVSNKASNLFKWKNHVWLAAADAVTPLFTAGRIASNIEYAISKYKQSVASYLDTVLVAFQQVEDALYSIDATKKQLLHLMRDEDASQKAYDIANTRYRMGLETYLTVVSAERTLLDVERLKIEVTRKQYSNTISLINSLGGYWSNNNEEHLSSLSK
jgi:multidrug efflux system outer membrane protein